MDIDKYYDLTNCKGHVINYNEMIPIIYEDK